MEVVISVMQGYIVDLIPVRKWPFRLPVEVHLDQGTWNRSEIPPELAPRHEI